VSYVYQLLVVFFFFSSRRRHTILQGDWSSDVCSSDLSEPRNLLVADLGARWISAQVICVSFDLELGAKLLGYLRKLVVGGLYRRSEERRVGKSVVLGGGRVITKKRISSVCGRLRKN